MPLARLLPFDTALFMPNRRTPSPMASAVRHGPRIFLSAANALMPDGSVAGLGDPHDNV